MKLLLDAHHSATVAGSLRSRGHDAVAAAADPALSGAQEEELLRWASAEGRVLVTEDVKDFHRLAREWATGGRHHAGLIFAPARRFARNRIAYPGDLIEALARLLACPPAPTEDWIHWLE